MSISKNILLIREKKGITRNELARKLGLTPATITRYEKGDRQPSLDILTQIAEALSVDIVELLEVEKLSLPEKVYVNTKSGTLTHDLGAQEIKSRIPKQDIWESLMDLQKHAYDKTGVYVGLKGKEYTELLEEVFKTINNHAFKIELKRQGKLD
jgi:transcriptional regulator with XRE-family HTH domain